MKEALSLPANELSFYIYFFSHPQSPTHSCCLLVLKYWCVYSKAVHFDVPFFLLFLCRSLVLLLCLRCRCCQLQLVGHFKCQDTSEPLPLAFFLFFFFFPFLSPQLLPPFY